MEGKKYQVYHSKIVKRYMPYSRWEQSVRQLRYENSHMIQLSARNKYNIPVIIKYPWADDSEKSKAVYVCFSFLRLINQGYHRHRRHPQSASFLAASYRA